MVSETEFTKCNIPSLFKRIYEYFITKLYPLRLGIDQN
ncbi:hypothetical protein LEP1GSC170_4349 [Leptospira interrogans serovar Bataviae str. HAI135]|nr:hypothetical protein LEP1GSC170_4349 [Leptospira interrogans serovar Bataviae str. HAI135]